MTYKLGFNKCDVRFLSVSVMVAVTGTPGMKTFLWKDLNFTGVLCIELKGT